MRIAISTLSLFIRRPIVAIVLGLFLLSACGMPGAGTPPSQTASVLELSPAQAYTQFQQGVFFLDVRTQAEWNQFHIQGSTLIPLEQLPSRLHELPKDKPIIVVCQSGQRSLQGAGILLQAGFTQVSHVKGGYQAWMAGGYPVLNGVP
jgi:rhodanese-related sulfurtransferase